MEINDRRWWIGWRPWLPILVLLIIGAGLGLLVDPEFVDAVTEETNKLSENSEDPNLEVLLRPPILFLLVGLLAGAIVAYWGATEVNSKYRRLLDSFKKDTSSRVRESTGGLATHSVYAFEDIINSSSPLFIEPARKYGTTHLVFGDKSMLMNREYKYDMKERQLIKGGPQEEIMYDQISSIHLQGYRNYSELNITLSSGATKTVVGYNPSELDEVKSDLQEMMRSAREMK